VVLCSDGIIEAANPEGELFGYDRTREVIQQAGKQSLSARQLIQRVLDDVERFAGDGKQEDDQTVVVLRAESSTAPTPSELSRN
jgi:sigma-B regulation protein RsbU (phosphoserine phosphatase)